MDKTVAEFLALLDDCETQVLTDPSGYENNPHLYDALHRVYLRLCHGNIPDDAEGGDDNAEGGDRG